MPRSGVINDMKTTRTAIFGLVVCGLCGCASWTRNTGASSPYELTVNFTSSLFSDATFRIDTIVRPNVPFSMKCEDQAGNHYQVGGTLRLKTNNTFQFQPCQIEFRSASGDDSSSLGGPLELVLGQESG